MLPVRDLPHSSWAAMYGAVPDPHYQAQYRHHPPIVHVPSRHDYLHPPPPPANVLPTLTQAPPSTSSTLNGRTYRCVPLTYPVCGADGGCPAAWRSSSSQCERECAGSATRHVDLEVVRRDAKLTRSPRTDDPSPRHRALDWLSWMPRRRRRLTSSMSPRRP